MVEDHPHKIRHPIFDHAATQGWFDSDVFPIVKIVLMDVNEAPGVQAEDPLGV